MTGLEQAGDPDKAAAAIKAVIASPREDIIGLQHECPVRLGFLLTRQRAAHELHEASSECGTVVDDQATLIAAHPSCDAAWIKLFATSNVAEP